MGHGSGQPYLYGITNEKEFDPKAVTRASWAPPPPPKPKKEGPLIDFNKHPDSYLVVPYGNTEAKPMSTKTKAAIKWTRWTQWALRIIQLFGAAGTLVLAIMLRGMPASTSWIIRIPPGIDIVIAVYAIYHLFRPAKGRTPMSSATYHTFAGLADISLIPFYVFTAINANWNLGRDMEVELNMTDKLDGQWWSVFPSENLTVMLIQATFYAATAMVGLHFASLGIDVYLVLVFRKIAHMPPDMNPLEDNLTKRPMKSKHKYKDSNATLVDPDQFKSKHASINSDSTLTIPYPSPDRTSKASKHSSREPMLPDVNARNISFFHTRNDSDSSFNPHNPRTARMSRGVLEARERGGDYVSATNAASTRELTLAEHRASLLHGNGSVASLTVPPKIGSRPQSSHQSNKSFASSMSKPVNRYENEPVSPVYDDLKSDNWVVNTGAPRTSVKDFGNETRPGHRRAKSQFDAGEEAIGARGSPDLENSGTVRRPRTYQPVSQSADVFNDEPSQAMRPLAMNPPSPLYPADGNKENEKSRDADSYSIDSGSHYSQPSTTDSFDGSSSVNNGLRSSGTPKGKYYGDLASATRGIMRANSPLPNPSFTSADSSAAPPPIPRYRDSPPGTPGKKRPLSWFGAGLGSSYDFAANGSSQTHAGSGGRDGRSSANPNLYSQSRSPYMQQQQSQTAGSSYASYQSGSPSHVRGKSWQEPERNTPTRVISRSGADYEDAGLGLSTGNGSRRRDVSGKVAEEGRGGSGWGGFGGPSGWGLRGRKTSAGVS